MQIKECITSKPGLFEKKHIVFDEKVTIIFGKNDSGKSLIARAIIDTLWGNFSNRLLLNGNTWDSLCMDVLFSNSSGQYRFIKDSNKSFEILVKEGYLEKEVFRNNLKENINSNLRESLQATLSSSPGGNYLKDFFNKIDISTFLNISFMPSPVESTMNGTFNYNTLKHLFLDDSANFYSFYKNIKEDFDHEETYRLNHPFMNEILKTEGIIKDFDKKIQIIDIQNSKIDKLFRERNRIKEEIEGQEKELSEERTRKRTLLLILKNLEGLKESEKNIKNIEEEKHTEEEKIQLAFKLADEINNLFPQFIDFNETNKGNLLKIEEIYKEIRNIHESIENFNFTKKEKRRKMNKYIFTINISSSIIVLLALNVDIFFISNMDKPYILIGFLTISIFISLLLLLVYTFSPGLKEFKQLMKKRNEVELGLKKLLDENRIEIREFRFEYIYELLVQYFEEYGEYSTRKMELRKMRESLKDENYLNIIENKLNQLREEERAIKFEIDKYKKTLIYDENIELDIKKLKNTIFDINRKIRSIKEKIKFNGTIIVNINKEIKNNKNYKDEIDQLIKEKQKAEETRDNLVVNQNSVTYIMELFKQAIDRREENQLGKLINSTREKFHLLTNYNYTTILDDDHIRSLIKNNELSENFNPAMIHILFLSTKLAITDLLIEYEIDLPLIIDEPFLFMDDMRAAMLKKMLDDISSKRQIIIFTYNSSFKNFGSFVEL